MLEAFRGLVLRWLRVPPEPQPPAGDPQSLRVFRAAPNYFRLGLTLWGLRQFMALLGIVFWLAALGFARNEWQSRSASPAAPAPEPAATNAAPAAAVADSGNDSTTNAPAPSKRSRKGPRKDPAQFAAEVAKRLPGWVLPLVVILEIFGVVFFVGQALVSYAVLRLDYEQRWYMVTDRSLRIRSGVWTVWEMTMSFANLQQVVVTQGPLQRWLGLADLKVESAGGGGAVAAGQHGQTRSLHVGFFHGVGNAEEIRDLILARLREFRESGLGDPDEPVPGPTPALSGPPRTDETLLAARELLAAARGLRQALRATARSAHESDPQ